jgi:hypothetical protein
MGEQQRQSIQNLLTDSSISWYYRVTVMVSEIDGYGFRE